MNSGDNISEQVKRCFRNEDNFNRKVIKHISFQMKIKKEKLIFIKLYFIKNLLFNSFIYIYFVFHKIQVNINNYI